MKKEKRFKVGDNITYKDIKGCVHKYGVKGYYYNGGKEQGGFIGEITDYGSYIEDMDCWDIIVTIKDGGRYNMLECEFLEYDKPVVTNELFPIY